MKLTNLLVATEFTLRKEFQIFWWLSSPEESWRSAACLTSLARIYGSGRLAQFLIRCNQAEGAMTPQAGCLSLVGPIRENFDHLPQPCVLSVISWPTLIKVKFKQYNIQKIKGLPSTCKLMSLVAYQHGNCLPPGTISLDISQKAFLWLCLWPSSRNQLKFVSVCEMNLTTEPTMPCLMHWYIYIYNDGKISKATGPQVICQCIRHHMVCSIGVR